MALVSRSSPLQQPLYLEKKLAEKIGVPREQLAELRKQLLTKKQAWTEGRETVLTEPGLGRVLEVLRATSNASIGAVDFRDCLLDPPQEKNGAVHEPAGEIATNGLVELTVVRRYPNVRLLRAKFADDREVDVRVPNNTNFVPKMRLHARPCADRRNTYRLEGRCPRSRGRY